MAGTACADELVALAPRTVSLQDATIGRGQAGTVRVLLDSEGNENALGFSVVFDATLLAFGSAAMGDGMPAGSSLVVNGDAAAAGRVGFLLAAPVGAAVAAGVREILRLQLTAADGVSSITTPIAFDDQPVMREVTDAGINLLAVSSWVGCTVSLSIGGPCPGPYALIVPAAAHSNGQWQSDLDLFNAEATAPASVDIALLVANVSNLAPLTTSVTVPANQTLMIQDILGTTLPASNAALGIRFCGGSTFANTRFYNVGSGSSGTYGMWVPALPESAAVTPARKGYFHHLRYSTVSTSGFRVNIGFANATALQASVTVKLFGDAGELLGTKSYTLLPFSHRQITRIHELVSSPAVTHGSATVEVKTANGKVHAYAMLIDNKSSDPLYMPVSFK